MHKINNFCNSKIFLGLFPIVYMSGPLLTEILLIYITSFSVANLEKFRKKILKDNKFIQLFFFLIFCQSFINFPEINFKNIFYIRFYFYYVSVLILFEERENLKESFHLFLRNIIYILIILVAFNFIQLLTGVLTIDERLTLPLRQEEIAVSIYTKFYPLIFIFLFIVQKKLNNSFFLKYRNLFLTTIILVPIVVILSGERMNSIMLLMFCLFFLIRFNIKIFLYILILFLVVFVLNYKFEFINNTARLSYLIDRYATFDQIIRGNFLLESAWGNHYMAAFEIFKENYINGIGIKMFRIECFNIFLKTGYLCSTHPHNMYAEIAVETGIISLILFIIIIFKVFKIFIRNFLKKNFSLTEIMILSISTSILIYSFPLKSTGSFFNNYNSSFFWVYLGLLISLHEQKKN